MAGRYPEQRVACGILRQTWRHMTFLHWPVDPAVLEPRMPPSLVPDVDESGRAWVGVTLFLVDRFAPAVVHRRFPETNVRTYVRHAASGTDGIWFLGLLADHRGLVSAGRAIGAPYRRARLRLSRGPDDVVVYRNDDRGRSAAFGYDVTTTPRGPVDDADRTALDDFLTGRWRAFTRRWGIVAAVPVHHEPWPLQRCDVRAVTGPLVEASGLPPGTCDDQPVAHYAREVHARLGPPMPARAPARRRPAGPRRRADAVTATASRHPR